jgi:hypothetical protein
MISTLDVWYRTRNTSRSDAGRCASAKTLRGARPAKALRPVSFLAGGLAAPDTTTPPTSGCLNCASAPGRPHTRAFRHVAIVRRRSRPPQETSFLDRRRLSRKRTPKRGARHDWSDGPIWRVRSVSRSTHRDLRKVIHARTVWAVASGGNPAHSPAACRTCCQGGTRCHRGPRPPQVRRRPPTDRVQSLRVFLHADLVIHPHT